ncbi:hypothetical protein ACFZAD_24650 [Streptomyces iakyrus]|uniref:hypothetical protein n=1 Tax=Streptomyces iakyrus TaxID=68219 RepID=UPI0036E60405
MSDALIGTVMYWQWQLFKRPIDKRLRFRRKLFFAASIIIFVGNKIPIVMDVLVISHELARSQPSLAGMVYAMDNALTIFVLTLIFFLQYLITRIDNKKQSRDDSDVTLPSVDKR